MLVHCADALEILPGEASEPASNNSDSTTHEAASKDAAVSGEDGVLSTVVSTGLCCHVVACCMAAVLYRAVSCCV